MDEQHRRRYELAPVMRLREFAKLARHPRDTGAETRKAAETLILFGAVFWIPYAASGWGGGKKQP